VSESIYCQQARIEKRIPQNYDTDVLDADEWEKIMSSASRRIDSDIREACIRFPSVEDTPPTPPEIEDMATNVGIIMALEIIIPSAENSDFEPEIRRRWDQHNRDVTAIVKGTKHISEAQITDEALTFGVGSEFSLQTWEAELGDSASQDEIPTIIQSSVRITAPAAYTGYRYGRDRDFYVRFSPSVRKWILVDNRQLLDDGATVSYRKSYRRYTDTEDPADAPSGLIQVI